MKPDYNKPEEITLPAGTDEVACDGGLGPLGHPVVYYSFDGKDTIDCGYCDRAFTRAKK